MASRQPEANCANDAAVQDDTYLLELDDFKDRQPPPATTIFLQPIAAPSALGFGSYAAGTFVVGSWLASWWGDDDTTTYLWPFVMIYGGFAQNLAGMWAYSARDTFATVLHTSWGSYLLSLSLLWAFNAAALLPVLGRYEESMVIATWTVTMAVLTIILAVFAFARDFVTAATVLLLALGCICATVGWYLGSETLLRIGGYFWMISCLPALVRLAAFLMVESKPHRYSNGSHDMMPRMKSSQRAPMFERGWERGTFEPGVVQGNL